MITYKQLQAKHEKEYNEFPFGWAFSKEQFEEMLDKHNWRGEKLLSIGGGGFIRSADEKAFRPPKARSSCRVLASRILSASTIASPPYQRHCARLRGG